MTGFEDIISSAAASGNLSGVHITAGMAWKTLGSFVFGIAGMAYLAQGRKQNDVEKMLFGAGLTLASFLLF